MVLRWTAAEVLEAERGFRMLTGYRAMPALVAALRAHHTNRARSGVDQTEKAAYLIMKLLLNSNNEAGIAERPSSQPVPLPQSSDENLALGHRRPAVALQMSCRCGLCLRLFLYHRFDPSGLHGSHQCGMVFCILVRIGQGKVADGLVEGARLPR